ncbi:TetR-like C-terminal domain-containing protein [Nocardia tengchongensis]|uniref:TetR-like C-terminal domain-containing protein n=1 Tax=Nocardia tengchongensis TaxID=2055889 RepID=UPI0036575C32
MPPTRSTRRSASSPASHRRPSPTACSRPRVIEDRAQTGEPSVHGHHRRDDQHEHGSPIPGYDAPKDTVAPGATVVLLLADIAGQGAAADRLTPAALPTPLPAPVGADLRALIDQQSSDLPEEVLDRVFLGWTQLFGLVTFEIFGRLDGTIEAVADYFHHP